MTETQVAYQLRVLFDEKITAFYYDSFKGMFGKVQVEVLDYLYDNREARVQELADKMNIPKQHASKIIARLEEQKLVENRPDPKDKRASLYFLTKQGMELMDIHISKSNQHFEKLLEKLDREEQESLKNAMETMLGLLEKM